MPFSSLIKCINTPFLYPLGGHSHDKNLSIKFIIHLFTVIIKKIIIKYSQNYMLFFLFFQKL
ncbi:hypothetical protein HMPREF1547_01871 [Blautia sp. KLE 1732]|nr:hypothetical protein HMPREF1547_01871 [Blautia sp. KLE 1732]